MPLKSSPLHAGKRFEMTAIVERGKPVHGRQQFETGGKPIGVSALPLGVWKPPHTHPDIDAE
jgi:hypothetical protein